MKRLEFDAFFDRSLSVFSAAESKSPQLHILKADWSGFRVEVRCSCTQLWKRIAPAISHWAAPVDDHAPDLILHASSNRALQEPLVAPNWIGGQFTEAGVPLDMNGEAVDFDLRFQPWHKLIHAHRDGHGLFGWQIQKNCRGGKTRFLSVFCFTGVRETPHSSSCMLRPYHLMARHLG